MRRVEKSVLTCWMAFDSTAKQIGTFVIAASLAACSSTSMGKTGAHGTRDGGGAGDSGSGPAPAPTQCYGLDMPARALQFSSKAPSSLVPYSPTTAFRTADPADAGLDVARLEAALNFSTAHSHTQGIVVLRAGYIVAERYAASFSEAMRHESYSMAKSYSSALVGIAVEQKLLAGIRAPICESYPQWGCADAADARTRIEVTHAMNVKTGLEWHEDWRSNAQGPNDTFRGGANLLDYVLTKPVVDEPGTVQRYSTGDPALLSGVFQAVTGKTAFAYAKEVLLGPIGSSEILWNSDSKGRTTSYAGVQATAREFAKFGLLYAHRGEWDGRQVVPRAWVDFTTVPEDACKERYRYLWHVNPPLRLAKTDPSCADFPNCPPTELANLPRDGFFAEGVAGQFIFVFPSADLVVARVAADDLGSDYWDEYAAGFLDRIFAALEP